MLRPFLLLAAAIVSPAAGASPRRPPPAPEPQVSQPALPEQRLTADGRWSTPCATGRLTVASVPLDYAGGFRAVAAGLQIGMPADRRHGDRFRPWSQCAAARLTKALAGGEGIARVAVMIRYRLARRGGGRAQLFATVNGIPGIAVAADPFGDGVLPIIVPGARFGKSGQLDISLALEADRTTPDAMVVAEVRDVTVTVFLAPPPPPPPAKPPAAKPAKPAIKPTPRKPTPTKPPKVAPPNPNPTPAPKRIVAPTGPALSMKAYDLGPAMAAFAGVWEADKQVATIPINRLTVQPDPNRPSGAPKALTLVLPLRDKVALGGRDTRVTLVWSAHKQGLAEGWVELEVDGHKARKDIRGSDVSLVGQPLTVRVPAASVRTDDKLVMTLTAGARQSGAKSVSRVSVDALQIEVTP